LSSVSEFVVAARECNLWFMPFERNW